MVLYGYLIIGFSLIICTIGAALTEKTIDPSWWALTYLLLFYIGMFWFNGHTKKVDEGILEHHKEAAR